MQMTLDIPDDVAERLPGDESQRIIRPWPNHEKKQPTVTAPTACWTPGGLITQMDSSRDLSTT